MTSASGTGNLGSWPQAGGHTGLAAGDAICRSLAADAGLADASLFRAWLSTSTTDAYCHVAGLAGTKSSNCGQPSLPDAGPWQRTDGVSFSHRLSDLTATYDVLHPPLIDENGDAVEPNVETLTATGPDGSLDPDATGTCSDWQSASASLLAVTGKPQSGAIAWTDWSVPYFQSQKYCSLSYHLLCFDPGTGGALPGDPPQPGAWVFVTTASGSGDLHSWPEASGAFGLQAGDAICREQAAEGHLPAAEGYVAWLSISGARAIDRIAPDGPFRRPGGVRIAADKTELTAYPYRASDIETDEQRRHDNVLVFTGTDWQGNPTGDDCGAWWSTDASEYATLGLSSASSNDWTSGHGLGCDYAVGHLLCFSNVVILFADGFESGDTSQWSSSTP